jgi:cytochrome c biogenesis protein CcmG/thiol:disulfide interchange protein DsbE
VISRWLPLIVFGAIAVLLGVGVVMNAGRTQVEIQSPLVGRPAPDFALPDFAKPSQIVRQSDLRGQPYLLNVWASWCASCRVEHPVITDLALSGRITVIGYNYKDERAAAERWLRQLGNPYHRILVDESGRSAIEWGIYGTPETFLVDAEGIVRWKHVGPISPATVERELLPLLDAIGAGR